MLLKNYWHALGVIMRNSAVKVIGTSGTAVSMTASNADGVLYIYGAMGSVATSYGTKGILFGDGDNLPAIGDYKLSGNIISNINCSCATSRPSGENGYTVESIITITNTSTTEEVTIKEVGVAYGDILFERTLLDEPLTIPAGGIGKVTYEIKMVLPTE